MYADFLARSHTNLITFERREVVHKGFDFL